VFAAVLVVVCAGATLRLTDTDAREPVPRRRLADRASTLGPQQAAGSSLEGINTAIAQINAAAAQVALEQQAALDAQQIAESVSASEVSDSAVDWDAVAQCERGDEDWNSNHGPIYEGKLGFARSSWDAYRDDTMPDNAGDATREQQIIVAERIREVNGGGLRGAWGCWEYGGLGY
jgi:hypothetical protein